MSNIFKSSKDIEEENARLQEELEATTAKAQKTERTAVVGGIAGIALLAGSTAISGVKIIGLKARAHQAEKKAQQSAQKLQNFLNEHKETKEVTDEEIQKMVEEFNAIYGEVTESPKGIKAFKENAKLAKEFNKQNKDNKKNKKSRFTLLEVPTTPTSAASREGVKADETVAEEGETKDTAYEEIAENQNNEDIPESVSEEEEKGFLHAEWNDTEYDWQEYKGYVSADVKFPCESIHSDDRLEIIESYYGLFDKLKNAGAIRRSTLRINGRIIHEWNEK